MTNTIIICSIEEIEEQLLPILQQEFSIAKEIASDLYEIDLKPHLEQLKPSIYFLLEFPYVDRIYRDSYYHYFSTKLGNYKKDCIRLSLFEDEILAEDFRDNSRIPTISSHYMGFIVLRPTIPYIIGRSVISPQALQTNNFLLVSSTFQTTANFIKLQATGFPHASQDGETITCAETSLWAIMEYFSSKYSDYKPALPSTIHLVLKQVAVQRQIPSKGLYVNQLAFALKEFGFGSRIYGKEEFGTRNFKNMLSTYIESGLPLICAIDNEHVGGVIAHSLLIIGHQITQDMQIDNLKTTIEPDNDLSDWITHKNYQLFDNDEIEREFVFIDDNQPVYQLASLEKPTAHYNDTEWQDCEITHFIVPLYPKIYLEAFEAKSYFKQLLFSDHLFTIPNNSELFIRILLTSSRSYKNVIARDLYFPPELKTYILETAMPKFIWIGEISTKKLVKQKLVNGVLILDATEPNLQHYNALISMSYQNVYYYPDPETRDLLRIPLNLYPFGMYINNLNGF